MKEFVQKYKVQLLSVVSILLIITLSITFAYYSNIIGDAASTDVNLESGTTQSLTFTEGTPLNISIRQGNFGEGDGSISSSTTTTATLKKASSLDSASDTYYAYFKVTDNQFNYTTAEKTAEILLKVTDPTNTEIINIDGLNYVTVTDAATGNTLNGFDITEFDGTIIFGNNYEITTNGTTSQDWNIEIIFVNLPTDQNDHLGKQLDAEFVLSSKKPPIPLNTYLINNHNEAEHGLIQHTADIETSAGDNNYRYSGGDNLVQNNYVCFGSDEETCPEANLYRIMGIYDGIVKLTTATLLPDRAFDSGNDNRWEGADVTSASDDADINIYLNGEYLNSLPSKYQDMIKEHNYNIGEVYPDTISLKPKNFYEEEKTVKTTKAYKIGLMNPSDYLYASSKVNWNYNNYSGNGADEYYNTQNKETNNWLSYIGIYWTINPISFYSNYVWFVNNNDYIHYEAARIVFGTSPVLYLETNVKVLSGNGSQSEPFRVGL